MGILFSVVPELERLPPRSSDDRLESAYGDSDGEHVSILCSSRCKRGRSFHRFSHGRNSKISPRPCKHIFQQCRRTLDDHPTNPRCDTDPALYSDSVSGFLIIRIINSVSSANAATVLVPLLWPTLSITSILRSNLLSSAYFLLLSLGFLAVLASAALALRSKFWVATLPSFHFSNTGTISRVGRLRRIGVSAISLALVRREIRSATRRKEVVRLMAIPIILPVMISFPAIFSPAPTTSAASGLISPLFLAVPLLFGVGLGTLFLGMTSIGQEGKRLWNLSSLPIEAGTVVTSKILFTSLISTIGLVLGLALTVFFFQVSVLDALTFIAVGITLVLAEASLGVAIGSRYPDFSDGPRPRFVTIIGSIIGAFLGVIVMLLMSLPLVFLLLGRIFLLLPFSLQLSFFLGGMLGLIFARISYSLSIHSVDGILRELPN